MMQHFTSLPPEQEASFLVYEQKQTESLKSGAMLGIIFGVAIGALMVIISLVVEPTPDPHQAPAGSQTQKADK